MGLIPVANLSSRCLKKKRGAELFLWCHVLEMAEPVQSLMHSKSLAGAVEASKSMKYCLFLEKKKKAVIWVNLQQKQS